MHRLGPAEHGPHQAAHLLDSLPLDAQAHGEGGDLGRGGVALQDVVEGRGRGLGPQRLAPHQPPDHARPAPHLDQRRHLLLRDGRDGLNPTTGLGPARLGR